MTDRLIAYAVILLSIVFFAIGVAGAGIDQDDVFVGEVFSANLSVEAEGLPDSDYEDGSVKTIYGHWSVTDNTEQESVTLDEDTEELLPDQNGEVSFSHNFEREITEPGNYTYSVRIVEVEQEYDILSDEWEDEVTQLDEETYNFTAGEPDMFSVLLSGQFSVLI